MKTHWRRAVGLVLVAGAVLLVACSGKAPKAIASKPVVRDVPKSLRGTIGSEVTFRGIDPIVVSGLGLVVNLNNTGGQALGDRVAATMEREMGLRGIGTSLEMPGTPLDRRTPKEILRDPRVAVVIVKAAIAPGAPAGAKFDVFIEALNATSLDGGQLWTTPLRIGDDPTVFGQAQARAIASARGPIFINPFVDPSPGETGVTQRTGRVLDGGLVTNPLLVEMVPDTASHSRVASMVSAINSRLPAQAGDSGDTARGKTTPDVNSGPAVVLRVPRRFTDRPGDFLNLVRHLPIDDSFPEQRAKRYVDALKAEPNLANDLSWCLEALGERALPILRGLYDYSEVVPRLAALRAGARLGDPLAAAPLQEIAKMQRGVDRLEAIALLAEIEGSPRIDMTLRELLSEKEMLVRVAAYEALAKRAERVRRARFDSEILDDPGSVLTSVSPAHREVLAKALLPAGMLQGIERRPVGDKFLLDVVPFGDPLIYVTQQGQPRIVLFGENLIVRRPSVASVWNDRFLLSSEVGQTGVRLLYRREPDEPALTTSSETDQIQELIEIMARPSSTDEPRHGFNFTYAELVGALYEFSNSGVTNAAFATERDRLKAGILAAQAGQVQRDRPETPGAPEDVILLKPAPGTDSAPQDNRPQIVPLPARTSEQSRR